MTGTGNAAPGTTEDRAARWHQRVLPVTTLALTLVALAALAFPGFRHQVALSASHRDEPYVELYFARPADGPPAVCRTSGGVAKVTFEVRSHLHEDRRLAYTVLVGGVRRSGTVEVAPGRTAEVTRFGGPAGRAYDVSVRLPGLDQRLGAHCPGAAS
ncbi:hypothetical protein [Nocardioides sp.]|uniref:hypothetical protein n=1 Tax=Nocardioides sp. TaxID=35761 RepID=UPI002ED80D1B